MMKHTVYDGEMSRSLYTRILGHYESFRKKMKGNAKDKDNNEDDEEDEESSAFMFKHIEAKHKDNLKVINNINYIDILREMFALKITGNYRDPLTRQLTELVRIRTIFNKKEIDMEKGEKFGQTIEESMNSKFEGFAPYN